ncbi:Phosphotransferase enzyme family protein [compost metagenome]
MNSKTKYLLTHEEILNLVRKQFGQETSVGVIRELKGGMFNAAYLIELPDENQDAVLKVSVHPQARVLTYEQNLMRTEIEVYRRLAATGTVPVPRILGYDFTRCLIPSDYFFMSALKGQSMHSLRKKLQPVHLDKIKTELGHYFAHLHQIQGEYFGYFTGDAQLQFTTWKEAYLYMVHMIVEDGRRMGVKLPYNRIEMVLGQKEYLLEAVKNPSLVSFDLWPGNIFLLENGGNYEIEAIIDFERSFWGDPYADFPPAFLLFKDVRKEKLFWETYSSNSKDRKIISHEDHLRMQMYKIYIFLIMAIETYRYGKIYGKLQFLYSKSTIIKCLKELECQQ